MQRDSENEVKQEEPEPFKFHEDEFPPLKWQLKNHGQITTNQESRSLGLDHYLKANAKAYKMDIENILKDKPVIDVGRENCSHCDPRFRLIFSPEKN